MAERIPPQNLEAERAVIGSILIDTSSIEKVFDILEPNFFYDPRHTLIYEAIYSLHSKSKPLDVLTVTDELKRMKKVRESGGAAYLSEVVSQVPTAANIKRYAEIVKEKYVRRSLITFGAKLDETSRDEKRSLDEILDELESNLLHVSQDSDDHDFLDSTTLLEQQMERADEYARNPNGIRGLPTGIKSVDAILQGLHESDFIILAARPSVGKSAFAINIARHVAVNEGKTVAFFSLEMPGIQIIERMLAQQMGASLWNIRMGKLQKDEMRRYPEAQGKLGDAKILIDETPGVTVNQIRTKARRLKIEKGLDLLIIDYLQLMQARNIDNRAQAVGEMSRALKILARELEIPVIALSQLNRSIESRSRTDKTPQLSDLRESGSIEQDADLVMFLSRESSLDEEEEGNFPEQINVDLHIAKHRNGPIGKCSLIFKGAHQSYKDA